MYICIIARGNKPTYSKTNDMTNVVTFNFLAPITAKVSGGRRFTETHVIPCTNKLSAKKWAEIYLNSYFERGFKLTSIKL